MPSFEEHPYQSKINLGDMFMVHNQGTSFKNQTTHLRLNLSSFSHIWHPTNQLYIYTSKPKLKQVQQCHRTINKGQNDKLDHKGRKIYSRNLTHSQKPRNYSYILDQPWHCSLPNGKFLCYISCQTELHSAVPRKQSTSNW